MVILVIISPFLPAQSPNTLRWLPILEEWSNDGYDLHVLTSSFPGEGRDELKGNLHVHRRGHHTLRDALNNLFNIRKHRRSIPGSKMGSSSRLRGWLEKLTDILWRQFYWPDGSVLFCRAASRAVGDIVLEHKVSHVISVGLPFSSHLIAKQAKEEHPQLKWLMDIEDVFCFSKEFRVNNFKLYDKKNIDAERQCFDLADVVVLTNQRAKERYAELFPESVDKMAVIPPLLDSKQLPPHSRGDLGAGIVKLAFFGSFYERIRSPEPFLKFLELLLRKRPSLMERLEFHFVGEQSHFSRKVFQNYPSLHKLLHFHPLQRREQMYVLLEEMHFLLNFANTTDYHLPSKLVEMIYFQKPVINISLLHDCVSKQFLESQVELFHLLLTDDEISPALFSEFEEFIFKERNVKAYDLSAVKPYTSQIIADRYFRLLQN